MQSLPRIFLSNYSGILGRRLHYCVCSFTSPKQDALYLCRFDGLSPTSKENDDVVVDVEGNCNRYRTAPIELREVDGQAGQNRAPGTDTAVVEEKAGTERAA